MDFRKYFISSLYFLINVSFEELKAACESPAFSELKKQWMEFKRQALVELAVVVTIQLLSCVVMKAPNLIRLIGLLFATRRTMSVAAGFATTFFQHPKMMFVVFFRMVCLDFA